MFLSVFWATNRVLPLRSRDERRLTKSLVLGDSSFKSSMRITSPARRRSLNALRKASWRVLRETFLLKSRGLGPNTTPPPRHNGEAKDPARARPVPFWRQGFLPLPATSPIVL